MLNPAFNSFLKQLEVLILLPFANLSVVKVSKTYPISNDCKRFFSEVNGKTPIMVSTSPFLCPRQSAITVETENSK